MKINFDYNLLSHPYDDEPSSAFEIWSKISLKVMDETNGEVVKAILDLEWDILVFLEWFIENKSFIINEIFPIKIQEKSLSENIFNFYEDIENKHTSDGMIDNMYNYRTKHDISFGLGGINVKSIIIGLKRNVHTISYYGVQENWEYEINITDFFQQIEQVNSILNK
jgi:hypothetical protein